MLSILKGQNDQFFDRVVSDQRKGLLCLGIIGFKKNKKPGQFDRADNLQRFSHIFGGDLPFNLNLGLLKTTQALTIRMPADAGYRKGEGKHGNNAGKPFGSSSCQTL